MAPLRNVLLIFVLVFGSVSLAEAQRMTLARPVSVSFSKLDADSALHVLERKTGVRLTYNARFLPLHRQINARFDSVPLAVVLDSIFGNPLLNYKLTGRQLVVFRVNDTGNAAYPQPELSERLTGRVVNSGTGAPVPYASVSVLHRGYGVITNREGDFALEIPKGFLKDTLAVGFLGYHRLLVPVSGLQGFRVFRLYPKIISLPEILIRSTSARELVAGAISKIPSNDFLKSFTFRGFYREEIKKSNRYLSYTEALLDVYKKPARPTLYRNQVKLVKMRKFVNVNRHDTVMFKLKGGLQAVFQLDLIRERPGFLLLSDMDHYDYALQNMTVSNGRLLYVVSFAPRNGQVHPALQGTLYIDAVSLAIVRVAFHYERKSLRRQKIQYVVKSRGDVRAYPVMARYQVSYQLFRGKYYVHYVLGNIRFRVKRKKQWLRSTYSISFEIMSTDINNRHPVRFARKETMPVNRIFSDLVSGYDLSYWKNANILVPETDIKNALKGFKKEVLGHEK